MIGAKEDSLDREVEMTDYVCEAVQWRRRIGQDACIMNTLHTLLLVPASFS